MRPCVGPRPNVIVVAVGNLYRGDDGAGPEVARRLCTSLPTWVAVVEHDGEPAGLIDAWDRADLAIVVDAVRSQHGPPGRIFRVEVDAECDLGPETGVSMHGASPGQAVELARALDRLPRRLVLYGIEGKTFSPGLGLSPEVEASVAAVAARILEEVVR